MSTKAAAPRSSEEFIRATHGGSSGEEAGALMAFAAGILVRGRACLGARRVHIVCSPKGGGTFMWIADSAAAVIKGVNIVQPAAWWRPARPQWSAVASSQ